MKFYFLIICISLFSWQSSLANQNLLEPRVVGGDPVVDDDIPFIVSLQVHESHYCGGSLVAPTWVLTAAHCFGGFSNPDSVVIGIKDLTQRENAEVFEISQVIIHPFYDDGLRNSHDFALVKLSGQSSAPFAILNRVSPEHLPSSLLTAAGWGLVTETGQLSSILLEVEVPLVSRSECEKQFQDFFGDENKYIDESMLCAGYLQGGKDTCQGDSGGPIMHWNSATKSFTLVGVVSWGVGCARAGVSGVYGDVSAVVTWVESEISPIQMLAGILQ